MAILPPDREACVFSFLKIMLKIKNSKNPKAGDIYTYILVTHEPTPKPNSSFERHKKIRKHAHLYSAIYLQNLQNKMWSLQSNIYFAEVRSTFSITRWQEWESHSLSPWPILIECILKGQTLLTHTLHRGPVRSLAIKIPAEMVRNTFHPSMLNDFTCITYWLIS